MNVIRTIAAALAIFGAAVSAASAVEPIPGAAASLPGPAVTVTAARMADVSELIVVNGTLMAREEVQVAPEVEGLGVSEILVEEGDHVEKGQVLARLNRSSLDVQLTQINAQLAQADAAIAQAQAQVAQSKATALNTKRALDRASTLQKNGFGTSETLDQAQANASVSDAQLESSQKAVEAASASKKAIEAQRDQLNWRIARTEIRAPVAGLVGERNVRLGQIGTGLAGSPPMFRIIADGDVELEAEVPDLSLARLSKGMNVSVQPAGFVEPVAGQIRLVSPQVDKATRLGHVRIALPHDPKLAVGASAKGAIEVGRSTGLALPLSAVSYDKSGAYAQVVRESVVVTQRLKVGLVGPKLVEVLDGLKEGELVITRAGTFVRDGDRVRPVQASLEEAGQ